MIPAFQENQHGITDSIIASSALPTTMLLNICLSPEKSALEEATKTAMIINADQILLNAMYFNVRLMILMDGSI